MTLHDAPMHRFTLELEGDPRLGDQRAGQRWETVRPVLESGGGKLEVERDLRVR